MKRCLLLTFWVSVFGLMSACSSGDPDAADEAGIREVEATFLSRGVSVPYTYVAPAADEDSKFPLVVMAHGRAAPGRREVVSGSSQKPLESLASFKGPLLVLYGDKDDVVVPATSEAAIAAAVSSSEVVRHVVPGADHALGFYTNEPEIAAEVVATTAEFLRQRL